MLVRSTIEGITYGMRDSLDIMREMGIPLTVSRVSGGGARSALWRQILADTGRIEIARINVDQGPAYGAAILAGVGGGCYTSVEEACDSIIQEVDRVQPNEATANQYDSYLQEFRGAYASLKDGFRRMAKLLG